MNSENQVVIDLWPEVEPQPREQGFMAGAMMADWWDEGFSLLMEPALDRVRAVGAKWIVVAVVWNYSSLEETPRLERRGFSIGSVAMPDEELLRFASAAHARGLKVWVIPGDNPEMLPGGVETYFNMGPRSDAWWEARYREIETFILDTAQLAEEAGVELLSIPNPFAGEVAGWFSDDQQKRRFDEWMNGLVSRVGEVYSGELSSVVDEWSYDYTYYSRVDYLSNKFWYPVPENAAQLTIWVRDDLRRFRALSEKYGKPFFIDQVACEGGREYSCTSEPLEDPGGTAPAQPKLVIPLDDKTTGSVVADFYEVFFRAVEAEHWVKGVFVFGFPYDELQPPGPLAERVIEKWYRRWLGD